MKVTIIPNVIGAFGTDTKRLLKGLEDLVGGGRVKIIPNYSIIENGQNTEKSPGDLRRFAFPQTPVKKPSAKTDEKNSQGVSNNNNNNNNDNKNDNNICSYRLLYSKYSNSTD